MKPLLNSFWTAVAAIAIGLGLSSNVHANAISVTNLSIESASGGVAEIQFDLSWSNSWYLSWTDDGGATTITNWDAAWVFLKFKTPGGNWRHGLLAADGHTAPSGTQIDVATNEPGVHIGAFIRRSYEGSGSFVGEAMRLRWDYASSGLGGTNDVDVSLHAIEMVYIPEGAFAVGSGGQESGRFYTSPNSSNPYWIESENAISLGSSDGMLRSVTSFNAGSIPDEFPKGYAAIYSMKYEISQGQYASFLNHLEPGQADLRYPDFYATDRYTIQIVSGEYIAEAPDRACNYLSVTDILSYLAWAGLRPMTEFEFEKICRGSMLPEPNEFAWGSSSITGITGFDGVDGSGTEKATPVSANANFSVTGHSGGPVRVGIFAESGSSRQTSGASYYGVMEMSGNVSELVVAATSTEGRSFTPIHGGGSHSPLPSEWPTFQGLIRRGGDWTAPAWDTDRLMTSYRSTATSSTRQNSFGGRGVRTAPQL